MGLSCTPSPGDIISGNAALFAAAFIGMGLLCGFEMLFLVFNTFHRRAGLYFWSLVIAAVAEIVLNISDILYFWVLKDSCPGIVELLSIPGSFIYVVFEYLILYSRLRIIQPSEKKMRFLLGVIIAEAVFVELPYAIITLGSTISPESVFTPLYHTMWQVEAVLYTVVDTILSLAYVFQIREMWGTKSSPEAQSIVRGIYFMTAFVIVIDLSNAILVFMSSAYPIIYSLEGFIFAFKLKVEMWSLNQLTKISKVSLSTASISLVDSKMSEGT